MKAHLAGWPEWMGGVALIAPWIAYGLLSWANTETANGWFGVALAAILVSELLVLALVAPLIGYQRRYALWCLVPVLGFRIAWTFGTRLVRLSQAGFCEPVRVAGENQPTG